MDTNYIPDIPWNTCTNPINAIDFDVSLEGFKELEATLKLVGILLRETSDELYKSKENSRFTIGSVYKYVEFEYCDDYIAPVPSKYVNTLIPALLIAHQQDPISVMCIYNEFFSNKKEELTPLLDK